MFKKLVTFIVLLSMNIGIIAQAGNFISREDGYTTDVFGNNAAYLIQERFDTAFLTDVNGVRNNTLSGWDIDYRGGRVSLADGALRLWDGDDANAIILEREFLSHTGDNLVFESAFRPYSTDFLNFGYEFLDSDKNTALKVVAENNKLQYTNDDVHFEDIYSVCNEYCYLKIVFSMTDKTADIIVNGQRVCTAEINDAVASLSKLRIFTGVESDTYVDLKFVDLYINYIVSEHFNTVPAGEISVDWNKNGSFAEVVSVSGSDYSSDCQSLHIKNNTYISKNIGGTLGEYTINFKLLAYNKNDGIYAAFSSEKGSPAELKSKNGDLLFNNISIVKNYRNNFWYDFKFVINTETNNIKIYVNNKQKGLSAVSNCIYETLSFGNCDNLGVSFLLDDVEVYRIEKYDDYASEPIKATSENCDIGMVMYSMWREGSHYGWDTVSPYSDRKPYLGYYTEGSAEVADWEIKWLSENGVDYEIYPFVRPSGNSNAVKKLIRGEALNDGYFNAKYKNSMDFAIMYCGVTEKNLHGADDFINNVLPYWTEYYFSDPQYKTIDNCPIIYVYDIHNIIGVLDKASGGDGMGELERILNAVKAAVKQMGFDDVLFAVSGASDEVTESFPYIYKWAYNWLTDSYSQQISMIENYYSSGKNCIASISQGYDPTPWRVSTTGQITPQEFGLICDYFIDKTAELKSYGDKRAGLLTLNCWNEYGEGHFFSPTSKYGFGFLDTVREKFTERSDYVNEMPTSAALARMDVLYPAGRSALKRMTDKIEYSAEQVNDMNVISEISFSGAQDVAAWKKVRCSAWYDSENNAMAGIATDDDAQLSLDISGREIDLSKVDAVRVECYAKQSSQIKMFLGTTQTDVLSTNNSFYSKMDCSNTDNYQIYLLNPANINQLNGFIKTIRIDFDDSLYLLGKNFGIKSIQFLGGGERYSVTINGKKANLASMVENKETLYVPGYSVFSSYANANAVWENKSKKLTVEKNGKTVVFTAGSAVIEVDGYDKITQYPPYYKDGNLFIAYADLLGELGYECTVDSVAGTIEYTENGYKENNDDDCIWDFDSVDTQGWVGIYTAKIKAENGCMRISGYNDDPIIKKDGLSIDTGKYNYFFIRMKNLTRSNKLVVRFFDENGNRYDYNVTLNGDNEFSDYVIRLGEDDAWKSINTVTAIRIDPSEGMGVSYIDRIMLLEEYSPEPVYSLKAYNFSWSDSVIPTLNEENQGCFGGYNLKSGAAGALPINDGILTIETQDKTKSDALFIVSKVNYGGEYGSIDRLCDDKRYVKVELQYKASGKCEKLVIENRKMSNDITDTMTYTDFRDGEWKNAAAVFDMSKSTTDPENRRWFVLRGVVDVQDLDAKIMIRNLKISYAAENEADGVLGNNVIIRTGVKNTTGNKKDCSYAAVMAQFDKSALADIKIMHENCFLDINASYDNSYVLENVASEKLNLFMWRDLEGMSPIKGITSLIKH